MCTKYRFIDIRVIGLIELPANMSAGISEVRAMPQPVIVI